MEFLRFNTNIPEKLALKFPQGIRKEGVYGPQVFFTLVDGRGMYLDEPVAQKVYAANIQPGQEFWLCKRKAAGNGKTRRNIWDLYLEDPTPRNQESGLERDLRLSISQAERQNGAAAVPAEEQSEEQQPSNVRPIDTIARKNPVKSEKAAPWTETLLNHTNNLTDVYAAAIKHATEQHGGIVKNEDVRTMLVSLYISMAQKGKAS